MSLDGAPIFELLRNRINLRTIPFTERGSRLLLFGHDHGFSIRLAERWYKLDRQLSSYRTRPPLIDGLRFTDGHGQPLLFNLTTTYPHRIDVDTDIGRFSMAFVDAETLLIAPPPVPCGLIFEARLDLATVDRRGGVLRMTGDIRRNLAYTTNARILLNEIVASGHQQQAVRLLIDASAGSQAILLNITPRLGLNRRMPEVHQTFKAAQDNWAAWFRAAPEVAAEYYPQYYYACWVMRAGLISTRYYMSREAMAPSKVHYVGAWQWDNLFHALAYRHIEPQLALDQIRILIDHQRADGMIPDAIYDEGTVTHLTFPVEADVTKPPLIAWAAWKLYETLGDREFLEEIYEPLTRWNAWWFERNDLDGNGLCEYQHPFSSGLDDSPLWDEGMPVESPDLNAYLVLQMEALSRIAHQLGETQEAERWQQQADALAERLIRLRWDPQAGLFWATRNGSPIPIRTPVSLLPLLTGRLPHEMADRLVRHLTNEAEFWPRFPVPTVALDDPHFNPVQMWRGPTWANINYLLIEGLSRSGYPAIAAELRRRTLALIAGEADTYEYYHPQTGAAAPQAASMFGWTAALYIDLAVQASRENHEKAASQS